MRPCVRVPASGQRYDAILTPGGPGPNPPKWPAMAGGRHLTGRDAGPRGGPSVAASGPGAAGAGGSDDRLSCRHAKRAISMPGPAKQTGGTGRDTRCPRANHPDRPAAAHPVRADAGKDEEEPAACPPRAPAREAGMNQQAVLPVQRQGPSAISATTTATSPPCPRAMPLKDSQIMSENTVPAERVAQAPAIAGQGG